jgi:putative redox protein
MGDFIASAHGKSRGEKWAHDVRLGKHTIVADEPEPRGGKDAGPAPYALVLAGLAACTAMTLEMYAERKGWKLGEVKVDLRMFRDGEEERIERKIAIAEALSEEQRVRLAEISAKTPVTKTLKRAYVIETEIVVGS